MEAALEIREHAPVPSPAPVSEARTDVALGLTLLLVFTGWVDSFAYLPSIPWWSTVWLGPLLYGMRRTWTSGLRAARLRAFAPLGAAALLVFYELELGYTVRFPWWLGHAGMGASLAGLALLLRRNEPRAARRLLALVALVLVIPWLALTPLQDFFQRGVRLRAGMDVAQVLTLFDDAWIQQPDTFDGCERLPVATLRPEDWLTSEHLILYPFDGENCSADGIWLEFEGGRLTSAWISPD